MKKILSISAIAFATLGLIACGDDSSSSSASDNGNSCEFTIGKDSLSYKADFKIEGISFAIEGNLSADTTTFVETETFEVATDSVIEAECEEKTKEANETLAENDSDTDLEIDVKCENKKITITEKGTVASMDYVMSLGVIQESCEEVNKGGVIKDDDDDDEDFSDDEDSENADESGNDDDSSAEETTESDATEESE